jgi:hypothetical protein
MASQQSGSNSHVAETTPLLQPDGIIHDIAANEEQPRREEVAETRTWPVLIGTILSLATAITSIVLMVVVTVRTRSPPQYTSLPYQLYMLRRTVTVIVRTPWLFRTCLLTVT